VVILYLNAQLQYELFDLNANEPTPWTN